MDGITTENLTWDGTWDPAFDDFFVTKIDQDAETATEFWGVLDNWQFTPTPDCETEVQTGDQVLWAYNAFNAQYFLKLTASATTVAPNTPIDVQVTDGGTGTDIGGAQVAPVTTDPTTGFETVDTSDPSTVTTDSSGDAELEWSTPGWKRVKAVAADSIRSNRLDICVTPCGDPPADTLVRGEIPPTTTDNVPSGFTASPDTVTLTATAETGSTVAATYYTVGAAPADPTTSSSVYDPASKPVLTNGEEIKYFSVSSYGVDEPVETSNVAEVDTTAPTTTDNVPSGFTNAPETVTLNASDGTGSGVAATYYTVGVDPADPTTSSSVYDPASKPVLTNGEEIKYFSVDNVGNQEQVETSNVAEVDTTAPTTIDNVPAGFTNAPETVTLNASDGTGSGVAATYYTVGVDPADPTTSSSVYDPASKPVLTNGEEIKYFSVDNVGNQEQVETSNVAKVDTTAPTTIDNVPAGFTNAPDTVTLTAGDGTGSGVAATYYTVGAAPADPTTSSSVYDPASKPVLTNGEEIKYFSVDNVGNQEQVETSNVAKVDTTAPTTTDNVPGSPATGPVTVTLTATDGNGSGVAATYYTVGVDPADPTTSSSVYDPASKPVLTNGEEIKYFSVDNVGNAEAVETSNVVSISAPATTTATATTTTPTVTTPAVTIPPAVTARPAVDIKAPADGAHYVLGSKVTATYSCSDTGGPGISSCTSSIASGHLVPTNKLGTHTFAVETSDKAGNRVRRTLTYTVVAPTLSLVAAKHILLARSNSSIPVSCRLNVGDVKSCSIIIQHGGTTIATGESKGGSVDARLTSAGKKLLTRNLHSLTATVRGSAKPIEGSVSGKSATTIALNSQSYTTPSGAFEPNSATMTELGRQTIKNLVLGIGDAATIKCTGYTANLGLGVTPTALALGRARALAVCNQLRQDGVHAGFTIATEATRSPIASNSTAAGQAANRRVQITITHAGNS